ncbi:MAG: tetratricopeptide repeat protein [Planctomycetota bacterium]|nr:tetratricopeptide repeat protein [Planctomycetota bacterium]
MDAAVVLRLPGELPETVEHLNEEALAIGRLMVEFLPDRAEAHAQLAFAHLQLGQERPALESWQEALARDQNFAEAHVGIGVILKDQGENEQAIVSFRRAIELNPALEDAYRELTQVLLRIGQPEEALPVARECVRRFPTVCEDHFWLGQVYLELGNYDEARRSHQEAIRIDPETSLPYFSLARICARLGKNAEAAEYRERCAALRGAELEADRNRNRGYDDLTTQRSRVVKRHVVAGSLHLQFGDLRMAEAHWLRAAAIAPDDVATRQALVSLYQNQNRPGAELQFLDQLLRLEPDRSGHSLRKARLLIETETWPEAERLLQGVVEHRPDAADAHLLLAEMYLKQGSNESATAHAEAASSLAPSSQGFLLLAAARQAGGDHPGALLALKQALSLDSKNPEIRQAYEQLLKAN